MQLERINATATQPQAASPPPPSVSLGDPRIAQDWLAPSALPSGVRAEPVAVVAAHEGPGEIEGAREHLALAADVYNDQPNPPDGWRVAGPDDLDRLRLTPDLLERPDSSFRARVYVSDDDGPVRYVVAFRGSQTGEDWINNGQQLVGLSSEHYDKALRIGQRLASVELNVTLTGHSLGGGMASAAALASGHEADTFNASGLTASTIEQAQGDRSAPDIDAYYLRGDPLSLAQDGGDRILGGGLGSLLLGPVGAILGGALIDAPPAVGDRIPISPTPPEGQSWWDVSPGALHGLDWLQSGMNGMR